MCAHSSSSSSSRNLFDSFWLPLYALASPFLERGAIVCARPSCWAEWRHHHRERKKPVASGPKHKWISRVIKDARLLFSCNYIVGIDFIYTYHFIPISPVNPSLYISIDSLFYFHKHKLQHLQASVCWPERRVPVAWWRRPCYVEWMRLSRAVYIQHIHFMPNLSCHFDDGVSHRSIITRTSLYLPLPTVCT